MGDSDPSLLPQPAQQVPIQRMSGGGDTGSLLPRPPVDVPVIPMSGGGPEDSVLPQPAVATRITPMSGGGSYPVMKLRGYKPGKLEEDDQELKKEEKTMGIDNSLKYKNRRQEIWGDAFPQTYDASKIAKLHYMINTDEPIYIYYVYDFVRFLKILKKLKKKEGSENIFILLNKTNSPDEFSKVYKKFIDFIIVSDIDVFFLYDKSQTINTLIWNPSRERHAQQVFIFAEPTSIGVEFKKGDKPMQLIFTAYPTPPDEVKDNFIGLTSAETTKHLDFQEPKRWEEVVPRLEENKLYSVDDTKRLYFNANFIEIAYSDKPLDEPGPATAPVKGVEPTTSTPAVKSPPTTPVQAPVVKPGVQQYIVQKKNTVPLKIGSVDFELRKPTIDTQAAWDKGEFDENESKFFTELGFNEKLVATPRGAALAAKKGNFLKSLTISSCFKQNQFLVKHECESAQDFLQELLEVRQVQRLEQIRESLGSVQNYAIQIRKSREEKAAAAAKVAEAAAAAAAAKQETKEEKARRKESKEEKARREETEALLDSLVSSIKEKNKLNITPELDYDLFVDLHISLLFDWKVLNLIINLAPEYTKLKEEPNLSMINWKLINDDYSILTGGGAAYYAENIKNKFDIINDAVWLDTLEEIGTSTKKIYYEAVASFTLIQNDFRNSKAAYEANTRNKNLYKTFIEKKKIFTPSKKIFMSALEMGSLILGKPPVKAVAFYVKVFNKAINKALKASDDNDTVTEDSEIKRARETRNIVRKIAAKALADADVSAADKASITKGLTEVNTLT